MSDKCKPTSFHLLDRENEKNLITWTYPTINTDIKILIQHTCFSEGLESSDIFFYKHYQKCWIYIKQFIDNDTKKAVILTSECYRPDLYKFVCDMFVEICTTSGLNKVDLVKQYLNIYISGGVCLKKNLPETFILLKDFPQKTDLKGLIQSLGIETILIYNALLLKKRILVYHSDIKQLQQMLDSITKLIPLDKPGDILQPLVQKSAEFADKSKYYLNGTTNNSYLANQNLFDLLVNLQTQQIHISPKSKDYFQMSPLHKQIANSMMQSVESEASESEVIEVISKSTVELFKYFNTFLSEKDNRRQIVMQDVESKTKNKNLVKFIINLATVENIVVI